MKKIELRELRDMVGHLDISDINRVHAVPIPTAEPLTWHWQIYLPPGQRRKYRIALATGEKQEDRSLSGVSGSNPFETSGRFMLHAAITQNSDGELMLITKQLDKKLQPPDR